MRDREIRSQAASLFANKKNAVIFFTAFFVGVKRARR